MSTTPHAPNCTDAQLAARCSHRPVDEMAWQEFVRRFHATIRASVLKTLSLTGAMNDGGETAEQLTQAVYLRLIEDRSLALREVECARTDSMSKYLMLIAISVVRDHTRKQFPASRPN